MRIPKALLAVTTLLATGAAIHFWLQLRAERALTAQLREPLPLVDERAATVQPLMPPQMTAAPATAATAQAPAPIAPRLRPDQSLDVMTQIGGRPVFPAGLDAAQMEIAVRNLRAMYPDLESKARLTADEVAALLQLLAGNAQESEVFAQLGATKYAQWKDYQTTLESGRRVDEMRATLKTSTEPLRDEQATALANTIRTEQLRRAEEMRAQSFPVADPLAQLDVEEQNLRILEESQQRIFTAAASYLTPQQLAVMETAAKQQVQTRRMRLQQQRIRLQGGG